MQRAQIPVGGVGRAITVTGVLASIDEKVTVMVEIGVGATRVRTMGASGDTATAVIKHQVEATAKPAATVTPTVILTLIHIVVQLLVLLRPP